MSEFKVGDAVRHDKGTYQVDYLLGHEGTVVGYRQGGSDVEIRWSEPLPVLPHGEGEEPEPVTWTQFMPASYLSLVEREYDQDTVNAIIKHLRENHWLGSAQEIEREFAKPKTRTVTVGFQVPEGESVVDYLENVGIDYDIEGGN